MLLLSLVENHATSTISTVRSRSIERSISQVPIVGAASYGVLLSSSRPSRTRVAEVAELFATIPIYADFSAN